MIDFLVVSGSHEQAMTEYAQHLHEHFVNPVEIHRGRYRAPLAPGFSAELKPQAIADHIYPTGGIWKCDAAG